MDANIVIGVEDQPGDTFNEKTTREVLQMGIDGLEMLFASVAHEINEHKEELTNFDASKLVYHLRECVKILQNATGA